METNKLVEMCGAIKNSLKKHLLMKALCQLTSLAREEPDLFAKVYDRFENMKADYFRMQTYLSQGMTDVQTKSYFLSYLNEAYSIVQDIQLEQLIRKNSVFKACYTRSSSMQCSDIQEYLEKIATDEAMLSLNQSLDGKDKKAALLNIRKTIVEYRNKLFSYLLVSPQWKQAEREDMTKLITSSAVDEVSAQMMVSAIMLSCLTLFDMQKFLLLLDIYKLSENVKIKEKALVGCMLASITDDFYKEEINQCFKKECMQEPYLLRELTEMQKQLIMCSEAKKDSEALNNTLRKEFGNIDNLAKKIIRTPQQESSLDEIMHPEKEEENLGNLHNYFQKIADMESAGSDIFYYEFSHMKGQAFFHSLANWFTPFYYEHPQLGNFAELSDDKINFIKGVISDFSFSDSDAYSFVLSIYQLFQLNIIPQKYWDRNKNKYQPVLETKTSEQLASFYRRQYLRDLYRFFTVSSVNSFAPKIFQIQKDDIPAIYFLLHINDDEKIFGKAIKSICRFLFKRKKNEILSMFLRSPQIHDDEYDMLVATSYFKLKKDMSQAIPYLERLVPKYPDNMALVSMLVYGYAQKKEYEKTILLFESSHIWASLDPNLAVCLPKALYAIKKEKEALNKLYELYYKYPQNMDVLKTLSYFLFSLGEYEKAHQIHQKIVMEETCDEETLTECRIIEALYALNNKNEKDAFNALLKCLKKCKEEQLEEILENLIVKLDKYAQKMGQPARFMAQMLGERLYKYVYEHRQDLIITKSN